MQSRVVVGCQWGDEGKGKIVDLLADDADLIVRFQGGANAGHTVIIKGEKFILNLLPSGILREGKKCVIASGVVVDPRKLLDEISELKQHGISASGRLFVSGKSHIVFPYHKFMDQYLEKARGKGSLGTTKRGIGPAYTDRVARAGIRMYDILDENYFKDRLNEALKIKRIGIPDADAIEELSVEFNFQFINNIVDSIREYITDTSQLILGSLSNKESVLFEGAQGSLLDIDNGTYPFTTSSSTFLGGLFVGCGIAPFIPDESIGIVKAYTTRVGAGPFPTELSDVTGDKLRENGAEFGAATGRPRRCGWLDFPILHYTSELNGVNALAITKLDVLSGLDRIKVCTGYRYRNTILERFPDNSLILKDCQPIYEEYPGWKESLEKVKEYEELPENARYYLDAIEERLKVKIRYISIGADRSQTIRKY
ncbi:MAG: adenylosuccinate synthase [candidate division Zixibacteria bacterium]|nr:adenylosuccinate synthase [candidate division Zixibacteria bacterium]